METKPEIDSGSNGGVKPKLKGDTKVQNVHFSYPNKENGYILQGINIFIKKGEMIALLGPSGSGKSTLLSLIVRFFDPNFGNLVLQIWNINFFSKKLPSLDNRWVWSENY